MKRIMRISFTGLAILSLAMAVLLAIAWWQSHQPDPNTPGAHGHWNFVNDRSHIMQASDGAITSYYIDKAGEHTLWQIRYAWLVAACLLPPVVWLGFYLRSRRRRRAAGFDVMPAESSPQN